MSIDDIRALFPALPPDARETSPVDDRYNCIAWAARETEYLWWPIDFPTNGAYWPIDVGQREDSVGGFVAAFATLGYEVCDDGVLEPGFEKVALFVDAQGQPTHMARQLPSGKWTSKLGRAEDIEHPSPEDVCGRQYGTIEVFLRRAVLFDE